MQYVLAVFSENIIPIFFLIAIGFLLGKKAKLDPAVLTKLNFYILIPSFMFVTLTETDLPADVGRVIIAAVLLLIINAAAGLAVSKFRNFDRKMAGSFSGSLMFYNSGNIGIPLITLVFSSNGLERYLGLALAVQITVLLVQNVTTNTVGFYLARRHEGSVGQSLLKVFKLPIIYFIAMAIILKSLGFDAQKLPVWHSLSYARDAMIAIALLTLGIQLAATYLKNLKADVFLSAALRLIGGPAAAILINMLMQFEGVTAQAFLISSSVPTAVNTALIAIECRTNPEFASQTVIVSTLASSITLAGVIYLAQIIY